tara:strand:- start:1386 stop:5291 length:3906 start_codon:yes stop_codon:yes gene_type:complete
MALDRFGGQIIDTSTDRFGGTIITDQNKGVLAKDAYEKSRDRVAKEARGFWENISNALVGEEAEWGEYWNRGLGKTNISLMSQYYFNKEIGYGWEKAFDDEPEDTGILERLLESGVALIGDIPTFAIGALPAAAFPNPATIGFSGAFFNEALKTTYLEALQRGDVDTFTEWWDIFMKEGVNNGLKSGLMLGTSLAVPGLVGAKGLIASTVTQSAAFEAMGVLVNGELPTKETIINDALLFGLFNLGSFGRKKAAREQIKNNLKNSYQVVEQLTIDTTRWMETTAINLKSWSKGKKPDETAKPLEPDNPNLRILSGQTNPKLYLQKTLESWEALAENIHTHWFDQLYPIKKVVEQMYGKKTKSTFAQQTSKLDPYELFRNLPGAMEKALIWVEDGPFSIFSGNKYDAKGLNKVFETFKTQEDYDGFIEYRGSLRALDELKKGRKIVDEDGTSFEYERAREFIKNNKDKYDDINNEFSKYNRTHLFILEEAGILSPELRVVIDLLNRNHFPFHQLDEGFDLTGPSSKRVAFPLKKTPKVIKGPFKDPIETTYKNTAYYVQLAERNKALQAFFDMIDSDPDTAAALGITKQKKATKKTDITEKELSKILDIDEQIIKDAGLENLSIFRKEGIVSGNDISVFRNGKKETYTVPKELVEPLTGTNSFSATVTSSALAKITKAAKVSQGLRLGVILDIAYWTKNFFRDTIFTAVVTRNGFGVPFLRTWEGFTTLLFKNKNAQIIKEFRMSGALRSTFTQFQRYADPAFREQLTSRTVVNQASKNPLNKFVELLRAGAEYSEMSAKMGEFLYVKRNLEKLNLTRIDKLSKSEILERAGFEARDLFDFAKQGYRAEAVNNFSAFFSSQLRGYDKMFDALKNRPIETTLKAGLYITTPSILLWMDNHDDPLYVALPQWRKDLFWNISINKGTEDQFFLTIPKPFELGLLFGTSFERALDYAYKTNPDVTNNFLLENLKNMGSSLTLGATPDLLRPFGEIYFNKSIFTGRPIVPESRKNDLFPEFEKDLYTSEFAKSLGKINGLLNLPKFLQSPKKLDYIADAWFGGLGKQLRDLYDFTAKKLNLIDSPTPSAFNKDWIKNLDKLPFVKAFVIRQPGMSSSHIETFYNNLNKYKDMDRAYNQALTIQDEELRNDTIAKIQAEDPLGFSKYILLKNNQEIILELKKMNEQNYILYQSNFGKKEIEVIKEIKKQLGKKSTPKQILQELKKRVKSKINYEDDTLLFLIQDAVGDGTFIGKFLPSTNELQDLLDRNYKLMIDVAKNINELLRQIDSNTAPNDESYRNPVLKSIGL